MSCIPLQGTPFMQMSKNGQSWVIGRSDTKEMICLGEFNDSFGDIMLNNEEIYLHIKPDGSASQINIDKSVSDADLLIVGEDGSMVVKASIGNFWVVPLRFTDHLAKIAF
jgi:hypothetical protein